MTTNDRPEPGKIGNPADADTFSAYDVLRDGDRAGAIVADLLKRRERTASALHYRLRKLSEELDRGALKLERGERKYTINVTNHLHELPQLVELLVEQSDAYDNAVAFAESETRTARQANFHLEQAAAAFDAYVERMGLKGEHPLSGKMRQVGADLVAREDAEQAERDAAADAKRAAERQKRISRPLGSIERHHLLTCSAFGGVRARALHGLKLKAAHSLVDRGLMALVEKPDGAEFELTGEGQARAAELAEKTSAPKS